ncbi:MAG: thioredoxin [Marinilabiliales bacterium]|nr:MAG: thioredoxin [Marinilabiliales bacterium]
MKKLIFVFILAVAFGSTQIFAQDSKPVKLSSDTFDDFISEGIVLVDFWATWCGPCKRMNPVIEQLADSLQGQIKVGKVDTDHNSSLSKMFGIQYIPTTIIFVDGKAVDRKSGYQSLEQLIARLSPYLKED